MDEPTYHLHFSGLDGEETDFSGPLDLILQLLRKSKVEIRDIQIADILAQYLAYLEQRKKMDLAIASEFIQMASYLMLIKTKMLLSEAERAEGESEMENLMQSLEQRQRQAILEKIHTPMRALSEAETHAAGSFVKPPEPRRRDLAYRYRHDAADLSAVMLSLRENYSIRQKDPLHPLGQVAGREPYPVKEKAVAVLRFLKKGKCRLRALFAGSKTRSEVVAVFLSILELCRLHSIRVEDGENDFIVAQREQKGADAVGEG